MEAQQVGGRAALARWAPEAAPVLDGMEAAAWTGPDPTLLEMAAAACARVHDLSPLAPPVSAGPGPADGDWRHRSDLDAAARVALSFAERFATDVAALDDGDRAALFGALGDEAVGFVQAVYVVDMVNRARTVLDRLFGPSGPPPEPAAPTVGDGTLWSAIEELIRVVPGLQHVDPVTTELVRLRGARQHNCRLCRSLRSRSALAAGADEALFDAVDDPSGPGLSEAQQAALALTDAVIWTPGRVPEATVAALRAHWSEAQQVELVLDILRNATNKVAVAFGADEAHVADGVEVYDVSADGTITYGLTYP